MASAFPENLPDGWRKRIGSEKDAPYFKSLTKFLVSEYNSKKLVFPPRDKVLRTLQEVDFEDVRVVILGQDPYHGNGQAIGRSFAVPNDLKPKPPSLQNIYKEIQTDLGLEMDFEKSDLSGWTRQGVLLLNTVLTVRAHQAFSHRKMGWENFTDRVIVELNLRQAPVLFILWGAAAQKKKEIITNSHHYFLSSPHPSPLSASRGFFGSKPFSKANEILVKKMGLNPIDWQKTVH